MESRPCLSEFLEDLRFPIEVLGPVDLRAFLRFAVSCFSVAGLFQVRRSALHMALPISSPEARIEFRAPGESSGFGLLLCISITRLPTAASLL